MRSKFLYYFTDETTKSEGESKLDGLDEIPEEDGGDDVAGEVADEVHDQTMSEASSEIPLITNEQYNQYLKSLIKLLVGEQTTLEWARKGNCCVIPHTYN